MMVNGKMVKNMVIVKHIIKMVLYGMKVNTKKVNLKERDHSLFQKAEGINANLKKLKNMPKEHSIFLIEET